MVQVSESHVSMQSGVYFSDEVRPTTGWAIALRLMRLRLLYHLHIFACS